MSRRAASWRGAVVAVAGVLAVGLSGCGPADQDEPNRAEQTRPGSTVDVETHPGTAEDDYVGARADVRDLSCEQDGGAWVASGAVTNPTDEPANYRIYVSFLDADRDTRGLVEVNVDGVEPGQSEQWSGSLDVSGEDLDCVLRVERVTAS